MSEKVLEVVALAELWQSFPFLKNFHLSYTLCYIACGHEMMQSTQTALI